MCHAVEYIDIIPTHIVKGRKDTAMENTVQEYIKKLQHYYDEDGKLLQYPSKKPMRIIALIKIAEKIDGNRKYTEKEINEIIRSSIAFGDIELIRREMFQYKLIGRLKDGSQYWAEDDWRQMYAEYTGPADD